MINHRHIIVFIAFILIFSACKTGNKDRIRVSQGKIDLTNWDFHTDGNIKLDGEWEFYPDQLLTPKDFDGLEPLTGVKFVTVPDRSPTYSDKKTFLDTGFATYRLLIKLKEPTKLYAIETDHIYTSAKMWANDNQFSNIGTVAKNKNEARPKYYFNYEPFKADSNKNAINYIQIIIQVSDFVTSKKFGLTNSLTFGDYHTIEKKNNINKIIYFLALGIILIMGLYRLSLYFFIKNETKILFYFFLSLIVAVRSGLTNMIFLPEMNFIPINKFAYLSAALLPSLITAFFYYTFKKDYNKKIMMIIGIISTLFSLFYIIFPPIIYMKFDLLLYSFIVIILSYNLFLLFKTILKKRIGSIISFIGLLIIVLASINDMLVNARIIYFVYISHYAIIIFIISQSFLISKHFSTIFYQNKQLTDALNYQKNNLKILISKKTKKLAKTNDTLKLQTEEYRSQAAELEAITHELEKLSIIAQKTDNAVIMYDENFNITWVNAAFEKLYDATFYDYAEKNMHNLLKNSNQPDIENIINTAIDEERSMIYEIFNKSISGKEFWTQCTLTPIFNDNGIFQKMITIETDITSIKKANQKIVEQNTLITSSLNYAKSIQQAILPSHKRIRKFFDFFAIYRPKDIVSGDFYWYTHVTNLPLHINTDKITFFAVVDCTGHGVPGAFMSLISNRILDEIVHTREVYSPKIILKLLDMMIRQTLRQEETDNIDGVDIALCRIDDKKNSKKTLIYAGAISSLYLFNYEKGEIEKIRGDRLYIGGLMHGTKALRFTNKKKTLNKDDIIYLSSDGFIDQNNEAGRRFGSPKFVKLLNVIASKTFPEQKELLVSTLDNWQSVEIQRDDITVVGLRIKEQIVNK